MRPPRNRGRSLVSCRAALAACRSSRDLCALLPRRTDVSGSAILIAVQLADEIFNVIGRDISLEENVRQRRTLKADAHVVVFVAPEDDVGDVVSADIVGVLW